MSDNKEKELLNENAEPKAKEPKAEKKLSIEEKLLKAGIDLGDIPVEEVIKATAKKEQERAKQKVVKKVIKDFDEVPENQILGRNTVYSCYNRLNKTTSLINGMQFDGIIGLDKNVRNALKAKAYSSCTLKDYLIEFVEYQA